MASAVMPSEFRCFRHVLHFYARNLPLRTVATVTDGDDDGKRADKLEEEENTDGDWSAPRQLQHQKQCQLSSSSSLDHTISEPGTSAASGGARRDNHKTSRHRCVSSYFVLSLAPGSHGDGSRIYTSEVQRDTQHPVWQNIPVPTRHKFSALTRFIFSLYYCTTHPESVVPAPETDFLLYEMLIQMSHVQYVAASMTKGDTLPSLPCHVDNGPNSFVVLLRCLDGVFFPLHQGVQVDERGVVIHTTSTSHLYEAPANPSFLDSHTVTVHPRGKNVTTAGVKNMTLGDLKTCATATLAWRYLGELASARREEQQDFIDNLIDLHCVEGKEILVGQRAMLDASLDNIRERLLLQERDLHQLRERYKGGQEMLASQMSQLSELQVCIHDEEVQHKGVSEALADQEMKFAALNKQLGAVRKLRMGELQALFPVHRGTGALPDTICGYSLPVRSKTTGLTAEILYNWSIALGHAAHLVATVAVIYGCTLPRPLLLCGARSCILSKPGLPVASVVVSSAGPGDVKLPLYCARASDRPLMAAAVQLMLTNIVALAKVMGRHDIAVDAADAASMLEGGGRLGTILQQLLLVP